MTSRDLVGAVRLPDGCGIRGRGLRHPAPPGAAPDYGLYLGSRRTRHRYQGALPWPQQWIDWPDFLLPLDRDHAVREIGTLHHRAHTGQQVEVACGGGIGRTGTVIACLAVLAGLPPSDAITWTRMNYHHRAVETPWQRRWVSRFPAT